MTIKARAKDITISNEQYEYNERHRHNTKMRYIDEQSPAEKDEAKTEYYNAMANDHCHLIQSLDYLTNGDYGKGALLALESFATNKRMNHIAALSQLLGALEFRCPPAMVKNAWRMLTPKQKAKINKLFTNSLEEYNNERDERV